MSTLSYTTPPHAESVGDGLLVRLRSRHLDRTHARALAGELFELAAAGNGPHLYLDFAEVESVARDVLLRLVALDRKLQALGDRLVLINPRRSVYAGFHIAGVTEYLDVRAAEGEGARG